jgi:hypothetical protein
LGQYVCHTTLKGREVFQYIHHLSLREVQSERLVLLGQLERGRKQRKDETGG